MIFTENSLLLFDAVEASVRKTIGNVTDWEHAHSDHSLLRPFSTKSAKFLFIASKERVDQRNGWPVGLGLTFIRIFYFLPNN